LRHLNCSVVFNKQKDQVLFCRRVKEPFKGLYNFVGGKVEPGECSFDAAYRELKEETSIGREDILLTHLMDFYYYLDECYVEVYVGRLNKCIEVSGDENELYWSSLDNDFFDSGKYAGEGNIGHILMHVEMAKEQLLK